MPLLLQQEGGGWELRGEITWLPTAVLAQPWVSLYRAALWFRCVRSAVGRTGLHCGGWQLHVWLPRGARPAAVWYPPSRVHAYVCIFLFSISLSIYLSIHLSIYLSVYLSIYLYQGIEPGILGCHARTLRNFWGGPWQVVLVLHIFQGSYSSSPNPYLQ